MAEIEKVIEQLKQLKHCLTKKCDITCKYYEEDILSPCKYDVSCDVAIDDAIQTIIELQSESEEVCEWTLIDEDFNAYDTSCRSPWCLESGNPSDNEMNYCPYCGRKIKVIE